MAEDSCFSCRIDENQNAMVKITKSILGVVVKYECPHCGDALTSKINEVGKRDVCPVCALEYTVPGFADVKELQAKTAKTKEEEQRRCEEERRRAEDQKRDDDKLKELHQALVDAERRQIDQAFHRHPIRIGSERWVFDIFGVFALLAGFGIWASAEHILHEILGALAVLAAVIAFATASIVRALGYIHGEVQKNNVRQYDKDNPAD